MGHWVRRGEDVLHGAGREMDLLHAAMGTPVTARRTWLQTWIDCYDDQQPWLVGVEDEGGHGLAGVALLASRRVGGVARVVAGGDGPSDAVALVAADDPAARRLAAAVVDELQRHRRPWVMALRHVVRDDAVLPRLAGRLPRAVLSDGDVSPALRADRGPELRAYVSSSHHRGMNRIRNRMTREHHDPVVRHASDPDELRALLPEVERIFRARDRELGRPCALDHPQHGKFFRLVYERHADAGQVVLTTLDLDGRMAAYVLCFLDGSAHRMWNSRFDPDLGRLSPGKLAIDASVAHALAGGAREYDFMRGDESYKASYANTRPVALDLFAGSGPVTQAMTAGFVAARTRVRRLDEGDGRGARAVAASRRVRERWGR